MTRNRKIVKEIPADKAVLVALNLFWFGFILYIGSYVISATEQVNYVICNLFQVLGLLLLLPSVVILIHIKIESSYLKIVYFIYCLWLIGVVLRGIEFDYQTIKQLLLAPNSGMFLYLVPFVLLIPITPAFLKKVFVVIVVLCIVYLIYDMLFIRQLLFPTENLRSQGITEYFTQQLSLPGGFLILTYIYHSRKVNLFVLFTVIVTFVLAVIRARRGLMFMSFSMLFFSFFIYQYVNKTKVVNIILSLFFVLIMTFVAVKIYNEKRKDTFSLITERIGQRTRSEVEQYFYRDMDAQDWLIGKGLNGEYFCPGVTEGIGRITIYRKVIETGYLQVILNGGLISLVLMLLIAIPAMFIGIFFSKNILGKTAGIWIFLFLLFMYPGTPTIFSLNYMLVWISISICYSEKIRNMSDKGIKNLLAATKTGHFQKSEL
jgi:hypothetical protein